MRLVSIQINGFKSFADQVELSFREGITAVVGPNGCGKSNIADALRWVLGSQTPRSLRADRMEDVIFSGSTSRRPMGMAEVSVVLDNSDRTVPLDYEEISITRRLFRSGDSEYALNGSRCRLMDITDLLADCGLGSNGYWILESEMVKTILSSRAEERRFLFDEAAGITRYKIQRHRARLKLDSASADLGRMEDIISEVGRNAEALRRQASLLARFRKAQEVLSSLERLAAGRILESIEGELSAASAELSSLESSERAAEAEHLASSARLAEARTLLEAARTRLEERQAAENAVGQRIAEARSARLLAVERASAAGRRSGELSSGALALGKRIEAMADPVSGLESRRDALRLRLEDEERLLGEAEGHFREASSVSAAAAAARDSARSALQAARTAHEDARRAWEEARSAADRAAFERESAEEEAARIASELAATAASREAASSASGSIASAIAAAGGERAALAGRLEGVLQALEEARTGSAVLEASVQALEREVAVLERSLADSEGGSIVEGLEVETGYEAAAGACLDSFQSARPAAPGELSGAADGRFVMDVGVSGQPLPEGTRRLSDLARSDLPEAMSVLSRTAVAADRAAALEAVLSGAGMAVVTPGGDLFRPDGLVRLGADAGGEGLLEKRAALSRLSAERVEALDALSAASRRISDLTHERETLVEEKNAADLAILDMERRLAAAGAGLASASDREAALLSRRERLTEVLAALEACRPPEEEPLVDRLRLASAEAGSSEALLADAERSLAEASERTAALLRERDLASHAIERTRLELESTLSGLESLMRTRDEYAAEIESLEARSAEAARESAEQGAAASAAGDELEKLEDSLGEARDARLEALSERAGALERVSGLERASSAAREALDTTRAARMEKSSRVAYLTERRRELAEPMPQVDPALMEKYSGMSDEALAREIGRAAEERERLGPVNMLADAEYREASERLRFLEGQRDDLASARDSIAEAIDEINATAAARFDETFEKVRENFSMIFGRFFEGGEAVLEAMPGEDPLEGGVRIAARPRGKTLENLSALSGGEKAMTAVALLFALYLVKPAPFCVLDELDAPLDDANVDRFIDLLESFSGGTQFIVVTHNRRTMEAADRLFGVTMTGNGVSALASVSLEEAVREDMG